MSVYLDVNSSAPIDERVLEFMIEIYKDGYGNADSRTHNYGDNARKIVENARRQVAELLNVESGEIFFTSGATESNNIAIQGMKAYAKKNKRNHIITTTIEHKAILETIKEMEKEGFEVDFVAPGEDGSVSAEEIIGLVRKETLLVSVMHVNNETGIIQPVKEIGKELSETDVFFHVDATQSAGKLVEELQELDYDMLSLSAHKLNGPQGVGALVLRKQNYTLPPIKGIMYGGQQEHGIRPGTIPVALVAGLGEACKIAAVEYIGNNGRCAELKKILMNCLEESGLEYKINGDPEKCIHNTINVVISGVSAEALMLATKEYCSISNGSACNTKSYEPSYVLKAMKVPIDEIESSIRISWGPNIDSRKVEKQFKKTLEVAKGLVF
ncbi:cysteine desulfurase family protein [Ohessyouella blattaphilus]|uniref:cysteine desulfurase n=1 Tax=Ohessyouella blattaphilus TaxID=2949333 RepID=A0ABT1EJM5_9FIRM|nr:cysteine desulfurase family protein [Ohessyouella blattaphilus]MCP1110893.1 cysteine desulfurase [Ohessyouella blattaphilus]MCR8564287.1 cysteine desulfurase [Ohessyouella blattaphilus]